MKIMEFFKSLGFAGYLLLGALLAIPLAPAASFLLRIGDDHLIATIANIVLVVTAFLAAIIMLRRNLGLFSGVVTWVPMYLVNFATIMLSLNLGGDGYALSQNPAFHEWKGFFYSLCAYQIPLLTGYILRHRRDRTGLFELSVDQIKKKGDIASLTHALDSPNVVTRRDATRALSGLNDMVALAPLIKALDDEDSEVRVCAIKGLMALGDSRGLKPILARLIQRPAGGPCGSNSIGCNWR